MLIPWSAFWERNYFLEGTALAAFFTSNYTRGAISGLGLVNVWAALGELSELFGRKPDHSATDADPASDAGPTSDIRNPR